jgi:exo-1,4-beta-D-glucosaminidase
MSVIALGSVFGYGALANAKGAASSGHRTELHHNWNLRSACATRDGGSNISVAGYNPRDWLTTDLPSTVLAAQVANHLFENPFFGKNLRDIPGTDYPIGKIYGYLPMTESSPYRCAWWYRTEFSIARLPNQKVWLHFNGINYRANIWVNGERIADRDHVAGALRSYEFDISERIRTDAPNAVAVEVFAQTENDLGIDFLDWNPAPADKSMGLWRDVYVATSGPVTVRNPAVVSHFGKDDLSEAELVVLVDVANHTDHAVRGTVRAKTGYFRVEKNVDLAAMEQRVVRFTSADFPQLRIEHPRVWWPYQYGEPHLEHLHVAYLAGGVESDSAETQFGIREVDGERNANGLFQFRINRRNLLVRGAGWTPDMFYREPRERLQQELSYVKHMNLNTIRLEGKLGSDDMFDLADEMGILIMAGWQCCDFWQQWGKWTTADHEIAAASTYSQISRLRAHPSLLVWLNGSDEAPPAQVEADAISLLQERDWPNPVLSAAADRTSTITGPTGVKMSGPYDYVPPEYWYLDTSKFGGAFGFNTETSPGPAIPEPSSIRRTLPKSSWWPIDEQWNYHAGLGKFAQYNLFNDAMAATYGPAKDFDDYQRKAQLMAYDGERAMFEAYGANKYTSTGVVQWMLNNAWPSFIWHLYDYYLVPAGGYFGTRKANEILHVQYRYDDRSVVVVNSTLKAYRGLRVSEKLVDLSGKMLFSRESSLDVAADSVTPAFSSSGAAGLGVKTLALPSQAATSFLQLELHDSSGRLVSDNSYWIPSKLAQLDWAKSTYYYTPATTYADMRDLEHLPRSAVKATATWDKPSGETRVQLRNFGSSVVFFVHLRAVKAGSEEDIAPVFWSDNYVSLLPGKSKWITLKRGEINRGPVQIQIKGWNISPQTLRVVNANRGAHPEAN